MSKFIEAWVFGGYNLLCYLGDVLEVGRGKCAKVGGAWRLKTLEFIELYYMKLK